MLTRLTIRNYAIIEELDIDFSKGLTIITGETGAGKSIILGALGLILGDRADSSALVNKEKKCVIEGVFHPGDKKKLQAFIRANDPDQGSEDPPDEWVLRREIGVNGKSRAFINDTPASLAQLQQLGALLVDLHRQFDTLQLAENDFQREVLDALADEPGVLETYQQLFRSWQQLHKQTEELKSQKQQFEKEADYNRFQFSELEEAGFRENELEEAEAELRLLNNSEGIKAALDKACYELAESETPLVQQLKILLNQLQQYAALQADLPDLLHRLQSAQIELQDIAGDLERISHHIQYNPVRIEQLQERLSLGYKLQKKHGVNSTADLLDIRKQLEEKLQAVLQIDETIQQKENELARISEKLKKTAEQISASRQQQIKPFIAKVNKLLAKVGMPNARLKVEMRSTDPDLYGTDAVEFLFNANLPAGGSEKQGQFQPLNKVASGGELSRLMLCVKSLVAKSINLPTLIFDEIDTGISGEAARQAGIILRELAAQRQVICITHQPQIAGKADTHFFVYKEIAGNMVKTTIRPLSVDERITAIARMLSGEKPTAAALENAREMIMN